MVIARVELELRKSERLQTNRGRLAECSEVENGDLFQVGADLSNRNHKIISVSFISLREGYGTV